MRWQSSIGVGEIVLVSYGLPGGRENTLIDYDEQRNIDLNQYGRSYNSTLWQKIYIEEAESKEYQLREIETIFVSGTYGLGYRLLASLTGETPKIDFVFNKGEVENGGNVLNANEHPRLTINTLDFDNPKITFWLPQSQVLEIATEYKKPGADTEDYLGTTPEIDYDDFSVLEDGKERINHPLLTFTLPEAWKWKHKFIIHEANVEPWVELKMLDDNETQQLTFHIAKPYNIELGDFDTSEPGTLPVVTLTPVYTTEIDKETGQKVETDEYTTLRLNMILPRTQTLDTNVLVEAIAPAENPDVELSEDLDKPQLTFYLPEAVEFIYGDMLLDYGIAPIRNNITIGQNIKDAQEGDYFIDKSTGFIYYIAATMDEQGAPITELEFRACLAGNIEVNSKVINPFTKTTISDETDSLEAFVFNLPTVEVDNTLETGVGFNFELPDTPKIVEIEYNELGSDEQGSASHKVINEDGYRLILNLPSGARWFVGEIDLEEYPNTQIDGLQSGDYYLNATLDEDSAIRGNIYRYDGTSWIFTGYNIEGPTGEALNIVASYEITGTAANNTVEIVGALLESTEYYGSKINNDELIVVNYTDEDETQTSYWYYCLNGVWGRALLTGGVASLIENSYVEAGDENKIYSISYVNSLISYAVDGTKEKNYKTYNAKKLDELFAQITQTIEDEILESQNKMAEDLKVVTDEFNEYKTSHNEEYQALNNTVDSISKEITDNVNQRLENLENENQTLKDALTWNALNILILPIFYIEEVPYNFEIDMTWEEWVNSNYNTDGYCFKESNPQIFESSLSQSVHKSDSLDIPETKTGVIIQNEKYVLRLSVWS